MYNGMMDPEMIRLAHEQMSKISPSELAKIQEQMMANPDLVRLATESMRNMRPEDMRNAAEQLKRTRPEDMVEISEKMTKATSEELAATRAHADAQVSYELNAAQMLKKQGNDLHNQGKFSDAAKKYLLAKKNLNGVPLSKGRSLQLACSLNLMSCYLKLGRYEECIKEGSELLEYDRTNVKALYRRGQAHKELGNLEAAVADLSSAHQVSPDDETVAEAFRNVNERLEQEGGGRNAQKGLVIEEIVEKEMQPTSSDNNASSEDYSVVHPKETSLHESDTQHPTAHDEHLHGLKDNPEAMRSFHNFISNSGSNTLADMSAGGILPDIVKTTSDMISKMSPEDLQKMIEMSSSLNGKKPIFLPEDGNGSRSTNGLQPAGVSPDMVKTASDMIIKMPPDELQKILEVASTLRGKDSPFSTYSNRSRIHATQQNPDVGESSLSTSVPTFRPGPSSSQLPASTAQFQEQMRNQMKDPAMRQMFTSMVQNMSPDMMANMSEQFGVKLSREEAAKAQQAMSSLSPEALDRMMRWADRIQRAANAAKKTKNWLLGRPGMILTICMLILAIILHRLAYIGG